MKFNAWPIILLALMALSSVSMSQEPHIVTWQMLGQMNYETGEMPPEMETLHQQSIRISGFIVPLEMDEYANEVQEFLLVPDPLACVHVPPPPPNQLIYVVMNQKIPVDMDYRGVEIVGVLNFVTANGIHGYEMTGLSARESTIEYEDPLLEILTIDIDE